MKQTSFESRQKNVRHNQQRMVDGIRRAKQLKNHKFKVRRVGAKPTKFSLSAPRKFWLNGEENRGLMLSFLAKIRTSLQYPSSIVHINFTQTDELHPCGTLFFRAHICNLIEEHNHRLSFSYPKNDVVGQLFQHIGLLEKMGLTSKYTVTSENVRHWYSVEGEVADTSGFKDLLKAYETELGQPISMGLYDSMTEAVTNSVQHAYLEGSTVNQKWWMFAQKNGKFLTVVIYDTGRGIPDSLRSKPEVIDYFQGRMMFPKNSDNRLLGVAVGSHRTSTKLDYRGKGLPDMMEFIRSTNIGGLLIHSLQGTYMYSATLKKETKKGFHQSLPGTLIEWTIPLSE